MQDLCDELLLCVLQFLSPLELTIVSGTCQQLNVLSHDTVLWKLHVLRLCRKHGITPDLNNPQGKYRSLTQGIQQVQKYFLHTDEYDPLDADSIVKHANSRHAGIWMFLLSGGYHVELCLPSSVMLLRSSTDVQLFPTPLNDNIKQMLKLGYRYFPTDEYVNGSLFSELVESGVIHGTVVYRSIGSIGTQGCRGPQGPEGRPGPRY